MTGGDARRGRRDNGLVAADYAAAGDVDPRVGEHLLDVLGLDGIAAYLRPSSDVNPITRSNSLPARPTDRLYVDRDHLQTAKALLDRLADDAGGARSASTPATPGPAAPSVPAPASRDRDRPEPTPNERSVEDAWAEIVAGYDAEIEPPRRSWPASEDVDGPPPLTVVDRTRTTPIRPSRDEDEDEPSLLDGLDTFGAGVPDDEENYTPPNAPPIPRPSLPTVLGVAGIVIGLIVFLKPDLLPIHESIAMFLGFAAILGGFGTLVWRLRPGDADDDGDPEDGARV